MADQRPTLCGYKGCNQPPRFVHRSASGTYIHYCRVHIDVVRKMFGRAKDAA